MAGEKICELRSIFDEARLKPRLQIGRQFRSICHAAPRSHPGPDTLWDKNMPHPAGNRIVNQKALHRQAAGSFGRNILRGNIVAPGSALGQT